VDLQSSPIEDALASGRITLSTPVPRWMGSTRVWEITVKDTQEGTSIKRPFISEDKAKAWAAEMREGAAQMKLAAHPGRNTVAGHQRCSVLDDDDDDGMPAMAAPITSQAASGQSAIKAARSTSGGAGFKLRAVREVLEAHGLDPVAEIARILNERVPVLGAKGAPLLDDNGEVVMRPAIDAELRMRTLASLVEYTTPKLKAIEHRHDGPPKTVEQINTEIAMLLSRSEREAAGNTEEPKA